MYSSNNFGVFIMNKVFISLFIFSLTPILGTRADTCPPPPTKIDPSVSSSAEFNTKTGQYRYSYKVSNGGAAALAINYFSLFLNQSPMESQSPKNWITTFNSASSLPTDFNWLAVPHMGSSTGSAVNLPTAVKPGSNLSGFVIESAQPPGIVQYHVEGYTQVPQTTATLANDEPEPSCEGWDFDNPRFQTLVTGMTTGPSNPGVASVRLRLRDEQGINHCHPIKPTQPDGKIGLLVLSSKDFDATQIQTSSIQFGPGLAAPLSVKEVPAGGDNLGSDEREEWERVRDLVLKKLPEKPRFPNLFLQFDLKSLQIQCGLDKALFMTATDSTGEKILGGVTINTLGCDVQHPGRRPKPGRKQ
jgi:hypothetical protein